MSAQGHSNTHDVNSHLPELTRNNTKPIFYHRSYPRRRHCIHIGSEKSSFLVWPLTSTTPPTTLTPTPTSHLPHSYSHLPPPSLLLPSSPSLTPTTLHPLPPSLLSLFAHHPHSYHSSPTTLTPTPTSHHPHSYSHLHPPSLLPLFAPTLHPYPNFNPCYTLITNFTTPSLPFLLHLFLTTPTLINLPCCIPFLRPDSTSYTPSYYTTTIPG
ncbi:hypothetical protein Pmani_023936 [Petrolisthes manimaculis]|uniref:Uncharacterized protein n=1 Tax=Petrolisthes manimaculis TaxID=1843537 RepID=A0AAE1PA77_9EUCA|nr:hypothetical protein Pmani_023936 [Petrolisthes manimaculis]